VYVGLSFVAKVGRPADTNTDHNRMIDNR
jgi:hypothetical protein